VSRAQLRILLIKAGRQRNIAVWVDRLHALFRAEQLRQLPRVAGASIIYRAAPTTALTDDGQVPSVAAKRPGPMSLRLSEITAVRSPMAVMVAGLACCNDTPDTAVGRQRDGIRGGARSPNTDAMTLCYSEKEHQPPGSLIPETVAARGGYSLTGVL
jgi:hypothetical protein